MECPNLGHFQYQAQGNLQETSIPGNTLSKMDKSEIATWLSQTGKKKEGTKQQAKGGASELSRIF